MSSENGSTRELVERLDREIAKGFEHGERFWSIRQLMDRFGVSSSLAQKVTSQLVGMGRLRSEPRSGTFVVKRAAGPSRTVAFVYGEWLEPYGDGLHFAVFNGAAQAIAAAGMALQYVALHGDDPASPRLAANLAADGVILSSRLDEALADIILARRLPAVAYRTARAGADSVVSDCRDGARQAVAHLVRLGHRRIAVLRGVHDHYDEWYDGYVAGLAAAGLPVDPDLVWTPKAARQHLEHLAVTGIAPAGATAAFLPNDSTAIHLIRATGVRVPDQLSVVGFEDRDPAGMIRPRLTTLAIHPERLGRAAARLLVQRLRGEARASFVFETVPVSLVVRDSTRALAPALAEDS